MAKKKTTKPQSYAAAIEELRTIVDQLEEGLIKVDELEQQSARAAELINFCREKLRTTEEKMNLHLDNF